MDFLISVPLQIKNLSYNGYLYFLQSSTVQVVYAVANEGTRLDIPEGPLGKLISGHSF